MKTYLNIRIDDRSALPVYEQIKRAVKMAVLTGALAEGEQVASIRDLAQQLQVNPNTIIKVYSQLETEGFLQSKPGSGYFVRLDRPRASKRQEESFRALTSDYIAKAVELGYSWDDIAAEIARRRGGGRSTS